MSTDTGERIEKLVASLAPHTTAIDGTFQATSAQMRAIRQALHSAKREDRIIFYFECDQERYEVEIKLDGSYRFSSRPIVRPC